MSYIDQFEIEDELNDQEQGQDCQKDDPQGAFKCVVRLLNARSFSEYELRKKLCDRKFTERAVQYAIDRLNGLSLIDDKQYAVSLVHHYKRKGYGEMRIKQELSRRGIDRELALQVICDDEDFELRAEDTIENFLNKRLDGCQDDKKAISKAVSALMRRGFTWEQISTALRKIADEQCD